jgi:hypothetical protein
MGRRYTDRLGEVFQFIRARTSKTGIEIRRELRQQPMLNVIQVFNNGEWECFYRVRTNDWRVFYRNVRTHMELSQASWPSLRFRLKSFVDSDDVADVMKKMSCKCEVCGRQIPKKYDDEFGIAIFKPHLICGRCQFRYKTIEGALAIILKRLASLDTLQTTKAPIKGP